METSSKKLGTIMNEIEMIYIDSQNLTKSSQHLDKKFQNYSKGTTLINEAYQLIEKMEQQVQKIEMENISSEQPQIAKINDYINILSKNNPKFDEVAYIIEQLCAANATIPKTAEVVDVNITLASEKAINDKV